MANFSPYTTPISPGDLYKEVPADLIYRSAATQYDRGLTNIAQAQANYDNIFKIPSLPGKDTEVLKQKEQAYLAEINKIASMGSPSDVQLNSKMRTFLQQASNDPDIMAVAQRGHAYQSELQTKKDYESKGKQYVSPLIRDAEKYINQGVYLKDKRFNKSGFVAPDNKELDEIAKNTPEWETWVTKGGYDYHQKGKAENSLANNYLTHFKNNPQWSQLLNDQFEQQIEGMDMNEAIANPTQAVAQLLPYLPESEKQEAINTLTEAQSLGDNPYLQSAIKDKLRNDYFNNQAYMAAQAKTYVNTVDKKANEFAKSANDFEEAKQLKVYEMQLKTGVQPNQGESQSSYVQRLAQESQKRDLEIAQAKRDITTQGQLEVEKAKQEGRMDVLEYKTKNGVIGVKGNKESKISIGDEQKDKATMIGDISRGNKTVIQEVINQFPKSFGLNVSSDTAVDPEGLFDGGVWITEENGVEYANYEANAIIGGTKYKVPLSDVAKYIADPTHIPTVIDEDGNTVSGNKDYIDKSNIDGEPKDYELDGKEYTYSQVEEAAKASGLTVDEYIKSVGGKKK